MRREEQGVHIQENVMSIRKIPHGRAVDFVELFYFLLSKVHYVLLGTVIMGAILGVYASSFVTPVYTATAKLYIVGRTGGSILSDLQIGSALTMDYQEVFRTWVVHEMVNEQLGTDYPYSDLQKMLSVTNPDNTRILYITVENEDPQTAANIANAYASAAQKFISQTMDSDEPTNFADALLPNKPSSTGVTGYIIRGCLIGMVLMLVCLSMFFILDDRPKSADDILTYTGLQTFAVIPKNTYSPKRSSLRRGGEE